MMFQPTKRRCLWVASAAWLMVLSGIGGAPAEEAPAGWQAGVARRDITPSEAVPMWGYGARRAAPSQGVLDPLLATALVLESHGRKLAIVGLDLGRSPSEASLNAIRTQIREEAGIEASFIAGSHTHHGPVVELADRPGRGRGRFDATLRYQEHLQNQIVAAVLEADRNRRPARMAVGTEQVEGLNRNRHGRVHPVPVDRDLSVMRFDDSEGKPIAVLVNFAAHPTLLKSSDLRFSAEYIGALRQIVEREHGGLMLFMQGASGDLSPAMEGRSGHVEYGEALGREVVRIAGAISVREGAPASMAFREEQVSFRPRIDMHNPLVRTALGMAFFPELIANYLDEYAEEVRPRLSVAMLDADVVIVGMSAEVFCAHAIRLKERATVPHLFFAGMCNGYHQYLPTIEAVAEGGYGTDPPMAPAEVGAGERLADAALMWIHAMQGKPPQSALQKMLGLE
ncbi:MAG: neutral/alkaline non-lysosomal ceramidase N-terminal domain-containing protein [Thermoguttaceae bacterium]|jgi:hypothetical protein|nr:neutral/alkaline non-lysosomal ceramidase N-terminal domain-containing protein [Thermoguttaceae bacterium]